SWVNDHRSRSAARVALGHWIVVITLRVMVALRPAPRVGFCAHRSESVTFARKRPRNLTNPVPREPGLGIKYVERLQSGLMSVGRACAPANGRFHRGGAQALEKRLAAPTHAPTSWRKRPMFANFWNNARIRQAQSRMSTRRARRHQPRRLRLALESFKS